MAYTFLQAVNETLRQTGLIQSDLSSFTDTSIQRQIDTMKESWNEAIDDVLDLADVPQETAEGTLTLATNQVSYSFSSDMSITDFVRMNSNPFNPTDEVILTPYPGGWAKLFTVDRSDFTGQPRHWVLNTSNQNLEIDVTPTSDENGDQYRFLYEKRVNLTATSDTFPFSDDVVDALVTAVNQVFKKKTKFEFDKDLWRLSMARAGRKISPHIKTKRWGTKTAAYSGDLISPDHW